MTVLALTMGEPAGIGGDISLKIWAERTTNNTPPFFMIADPKQLTTLADDLDFQLPIREITEPAEASALFANHLPVLPCPMAAPCVSGELNKKNAAAVQKSIETAVSLVQAEKASAVVTNPIQKQVLNEAGFPFPGHTEFLADLAGISTPPVMMLACDSLRVVPVTIHVSLAEAALSLTTEMIVTKSLITAEALKKDFGIKNPALAIAGLNPHAGEGGQMGTEDETIVKPAVEALKAQGINAFGPLPADTMFHTRARAEYDVAICMYHDQALIPIKTIDFDQGVNITLGLPFIRTSPDHGTALELAGKGIAKESSLLAALKMAASMVGKRDRGQ
ncbi:MAG: 4-hydroxythreonine-4-phosphate dehydrogenase PdxA [Rhodospirillales bacterium]|nr:4-hydroxythreonine-4-phosphate dehydrogenase PdxA [Rhodospirillales bacterium]